MSEPFLGQITMFAGNYAPRGYALCNGQIMNIAQNTALFSLLGTMYGGNGQTTFALPNLQSSLAMGLGQGPGLSNRTQGETGGSSGVTLQEAQMPAHSHTFSATTSAATTATIQSNSLPAKPTVANALFYAVPGAVPLPPQQVNPNCSGTAGQSQPHSNLMPSLCISFIIALQGIFPSRN